LGHPFLPMPPKMTHIRHRQRARLLLALAALISAWASGSVVSAAAPDEAAVFESRIRPLLADRCYECHSAAKKQKAGLTLDSKAGWEKGGDSGAPIVPGKPEESLLMKAVRWTDKDLQMPPEKAGGKLSGAEIADLEAWIKAGPMIRARTPRRFR